MCVCDTTTMDSEMFDQYEKHSPEEKIKWECLLLLTFP